MSTPITTWSASSVSLFDPNRGGCRRKWYFERIMKVPRPSHPAAVNGQRIHKVLEDLYSGALTEIPSVLKPAFDRGHLPAFPAPNVEVEFDFRSIGDEFKIGEWRANGRIDLLIRDPGMPVVLDLKTSSSYRYSATEESLAMDIQAVLYSAVAQKITGASTSRFGHVQVLTTIRPDSRLVMVDMTAEHVTEHMERRIRPVVLDMQEAALAKSVSDLAANRAACYSYGGCPYQAQCSAATSAFHLNLPSTIEEVSMPDNTPSSVSSALSQFQNRVRTPAAPVIAPEPSVTEDSSDLDMDTRMAAPRKAVPAMPPVSKPAPIVAATERDSQAPSTVSRSVPTASVSQQIPLMTATKAPAPAPAPASTLALYINCRPDTGAQEMNTVLVPFRQMVCDSAQVGHWGLVEYGKGATMVAALLDNAVAHGLVLGDVWLSLADPGMREVVQVLSHRAGRIIRGIQ